MGEARVMVYPDAARAVEAFKAAEEAMQRLAAALRCDDVKGALRCQLVGGHAGLHRAEWEATEQCMAKTDGGVCIAGAGHPGGHV